MLHRQSFCKILFLVVRDGWDKVVVTVASYSYGSDE
jgi:hypothetical protein